MRKIKLILISIGICTLCTSFMKAEKRQMEYLNRGLVAVKVSKGVYLSWRMKGTDNKNIAFNIYRNNIVLVNSILIFDSTNYLDSIGNIRDKYSVKPVINGKEENDESLISVTPWEIIYIYYYYTNNSQALYSYARPYIPIGGCMAECSL